jgi:hypothetical protein
MKFHHSASCLLLISTAALADNTSSIEIFASNNTTEIDLPTAYQRLTSAPQQQLQTSTITVLQKNHIEEGTLKDILGTYRMSSDQNTTADNTEVFYTSPEQQLDHKQIIELAQQLAVTLKQESVAVFIPNNTTQVGEIKVTFKPNQSSIPDTVKLLQTTLPSAYNQAFSMQLNNEYAGYDKTKVASVEWLGSKLNLALIRQAFPTAEVSYRDGVALLVYADGHVEEL